MATRPTRTGAHLLALMSHTRGRLLATSRFAFASEEELSQLADLVNEGFAPANTARQNHSLGTKRLPTVDGNYYSYFAACCSCISILCSHHNYYRLCCIYFTIYVYQLFYYNETAIQHLMTSCMPEGGKYKLYIFSLVPLWEGNYPSYTQAGIIQKYT